MATTNSFLMPNSYYITFSSKESSCLSNIYINPELNIINTSSEVLDLGVYMSSNCTLDFHVSCVYKRCLNLRGYRTVIFDKFEIFYGEFIFC